MVDSRLKIYNAKLMVRGVGDMGHGHVWRLISTYEHHKYIFLLGPALKYLLEISTPTGQHTVYFISDRL